MTQLSQKYILFNFKVPCGNLELGNQNFKNLHDLSLNYYMVTQLTFRSRLTRLAMWQQGLK